MIHCYLRTSNDNAGSCLLFKAGESNFIAERKVATTLKIPVEPLNLIKRLLFPSVLILLKEQQYSVKRVC